MAPRDILKDRFAVGLAKEGTTYAATTEIIALRGAETQLPQAAEACKHHA
jgi:hypothetical protein